MSCSTRDTSPRDFSIMNLGRKQKSIVYSEMQLFNVKDGLGLLKLADTVMILINPSPSNVKR